MMLLEKKGERKMAAIDLAIFATLIITVIIAIKIYKD